MLGGKVKGMEEWQQVSFRIATISGPQPTTCYRPAVTLTDIHLLIAQPVLTGTRGPLIRLVQGCRRRSPLRPSFGTLSCGTGARLLLAGRRGFLSETAYSLPLKRARETWAHGDQTEDGAITISPASVGCPVEVPVGGLHQPVGGGPVTVSEAVQRGQGAAGSDFEDRAIAAGPAA